MKYDLITFQSRAEARQWLLDNDYSPRCVWLPANTTPGLWCKVTGEAVQAFKNCSDTWTVQQYKTPNLNDYISE